MIDDDDDNDNDDQYCTDEFNENQSRTVYLFFMNMTGTTFTHVQ